MGNNLVAFIVLIIYFIGLFVLAAIANAMQKKRAQQMGTDGAEGYLMASRSMGFGTIMCTIMGVAIGANATTGAAQGGYQYGLAAGTHPPAALALVNTLARLIGVPVETTELEPSTIFRPEHMPNSRQAHIAP